MNHSLTQPDRSPMTMTNSSSTDNMILDDLPLMDWFDPQQAFESCLVHATHENEPWPAFNDVAIDEGPRQSNALAVITSPSSIPQGFDCNFDFDLNSATLMPTTSIPQPTTSTVLEVPSSLDIQPPDDPVYVVKSDATVCNICGRCFVGKGAAVRKHIVDIHLKKEGVKGTVIRGTPGRPRTKVAIQCATKRKRNVEEYVTADEYARLKKDYLVAKKQQKDLLVGVLLEARMHNHVYDLLQKFDSVPGQYKFMDLINKIHNADFHLSFWLKLIRDPVYHFCPKCLDMAYRMYLSELIDQRNKHEMKINQIGWYKEITQATLMPMDRVYVIYLDRYCLVDKTVRSELGWTHPCSPPMTDVGNVGRKVIHVIKFSEN